MSIETFLVSHKNIIKSFRWIYDIYIKLKNTNKLYIVDKFGKKKRVRHIKNFNVKIEGLGKVVIIDSTANFKDINGIVSGNNNEIIIGKRCVFHNEVYIGMCCNRNNRKIIIEDDVSIIQAEFHCWGNGSKIHIKKDCMFSLMVRINNSDGHPIFDRESGKVINEGKFVIVGEHCWLGHNVTILKNVEIASNTIIGAHSLVTKSLQEEYCAYAGIPAKVIRRNVDWSKDNV